MVMQDSGWTFWSCQSVLRNLTAASAQGYAAIGEAIDAVGFEGKRLRDVAGGIAAGFVGGTALGGWKGVGV